MARAEHRSWYRIALARTAGPSALIAVQGEHLGAAIAAAERRMPGTYAFAAEVATAEIPLGESVGKHQIVELGTPPGGEGQPAPFHWPRGVTPQLGHTEPLAGARRGWITHPDPKLLVIEAQTDADHLVDLYLGLVEQLPSADNLEIRVLDHFEDTGTTDVWLTSRVNAKKIIAFLDDFEDDLIHNGHIEISIYIRAHKATLRLTEHKTVVWIADDRSLETEVTGWLRDLAVPAAEALTRVVEVPHFHLRAAKSRNRKKLGDELYRQRLRRVDTIRAPEALERGGRDTDG